MEVLFYLFFFVILGLVVGYSLRYGITPTPTSSKVKRQLLKILPLQIEGSIAELGSGWGNLAFALAHHFPYNLVKAYEISPLPYYTSKLISYLSSYSNLDFIHQDFFTISLKDVSLVVCYLYPDVMIRLKTKFEAELNPNAYVLSHTFAIPGWKPICLVKADDLYQTPIYLYQIKQSISKKSL